jgi:hypothetical protein
MSGDLAHAQAGLRAMFTPPAWVVGGISGGDAEFLLDLVMREQPARVLEVGVAAGTSSAALLYALDALPEPANRELWSVDIRPMCYFDLRRATGSAVAEMHPRHTSRWFLQTNADARLAARSLGPASTDLLFIDGNHSHPWPLLDVLHLATAARPQAWIALHDIALPRLYPEFQTFGPTWLFAAWPGEKIAGQGDAENIGAVRLPADLAALVPMAVELLRAHPWEAPVRREDVELPDVFAAVNFSRAL